MQKSLYRRDSVLTITGTITDLTTVTANVNGVALVVDSATHAFSQVVQLAQGTNFISITATDAAGNATSVVRQVTLDNVPPTLTLTAPAQGLITKTATATVVGSAVGQSAVTVTVNGANVALGANGAFTSNVALTEGSNGITVVATNAAGVTATATRTVILDTQPPTLTWSAPLDNAITKNAIVDVTGSVYDQTAVTLTLNGAAVGLTTVDATTKSFLSLEPVVEDGPASLTLVATDAAGNVATLKRTITKDATAPVITVIEPAIDLVTNAAMAHVAGSVADLTASTLTVNGAPIAIATDGGFVGDVPIVGGANTLTFVATDAAGNQTTVTRALVRDVDPPVVTVSSPSDNVLVKTSTVTVSGTITDASAVTATLNGAPLTIAADRSYTTTIALLEGPNTLTLVATDAAGNATTTNQSVTLDTQAPVLTVTSPANGFSTQADNVGVSGTATDQSAVKVTVNGATATLSSGGAFSATAALTIGSNSILVVATDSAGNSSSTTRSVTREPAIDPNLPPNPKTVAPALNRTVATTQAAASSFLYTGSNPIQTGVAPSTILPERASTLRGRVITATGAALPGASVAIMGHPEFGGTKSRADGWYDLVVNGGGKVTVQYAKDGYLGAQRTVTAPRQDYGRIDDVALIKPDAAVSVVQLGGSTAQIAVGSPLTDKDGARTATMIFDAGTTATLKKLDGTTQPIALLSIRLTEYTVGDNGREAMPAPLPPTSGYTYAVSPTADEALAVGGTVTFSKPVSTYVEDFLGFPVGMKVPLGVLDAGTTSWVPQPDGRVIKVLSVSGGVATIDANGDGAADPQIVLDSLGFTTTELAQLAATYTPGKTLMRTRLFGLYPFDANLPFRAHGVDPVVVAPPGCASATRDIIKCDVRVATQAVDVPGTPYTLAYTSARAAGAADRTLRIPVTGATMPAELMGAYVRVTVAGQTTEQQYQPAANITYEYVWDGNDAYGRPVQGNPTAVVEIGHLFPVDYMLPAQDAASFGLPCASTAANGVAACQLAYSNSYDTERHSFWRVSSAITKLGGLDAKAQGLGGFDFNVHHQYDPVGRVLYLGDGTTRIADAISPVVTTVYGNGCAGYSLDNIKATDACLFYPHRETLVAMPDGSFLVPNSGSIKRVRPDGISVRFAGDYPPCPPCYPDGNIHGEGGPATSATVGAVGPIALGPDGSVYAGSEAGGIERIVRISPDGILTRVMGGAGPLAADGRPVQGTSLDRIEALTVGPDGSVYFVQRTQEWRVYRIGPDSVIHTFAGIGAWGSGGDEQLAKQAQFTFIKALAFGPDGSLYIGQWDDFNIGNNRVRRVTPDGVLHLVAGGGAAGGSGVPATQRALFRVQSLYVNPEGTVSIGAHNVVVQVTADGIFHVVAGDPTTTAFTGDRGPSLKAGFSLIAGLAEMPDRSLLIYDADHHRVRKMAAPMPGFGGGAFIVANESGELLYVFDAAGRHLKTIDRQSKKPIYVFSYNASGYLVGLGDMEGDVTLVERDASGAALALIAPTGQRTALTIDASGEIRAITAPDGSTMQFGSAGSGLILSATDAEGHSAGFAYDVTGRLSTRTSEDGGSMILSLVPMPVGQRVEISSTAGTRTSVDVNGLASGGQRSVATTADGRQATVTTNADGSALAQFPDGSELGVAIQKDADSESAATLFTAALRIPTGLGTRTKSIRSGVGVLLDVDGEVAVETDSLIVNGKVSTTVRDNRAGTITARSAEGRTVVTLMDSLGRVAKDSATGFVATEYVYDGDGNVIIERRGERTWHFTYDSAGRRTSAIAPNGQVTRFGHNAADRLTSKFNQGTDSVVVAYDDVGMITGVTPPGRPTHTFARTATGLITSYSPPAVSGAGGATLYSYDQDGKPLTTVRPSGDTISAKYDSAAKLTSLVTFEGTYSFTYDSAGRLQQATSPNGGTLRHEYAGPFLAKTTWFGLVNGQVSHSYDNDLMPASQTISGSQAITFGYDNDGLLIGAGALTIARDPQTGFEIGTRMGTITTGSAFDAFGAIARDSVAFNGTTLYSAWLTRDSVGRIIKRRENVRGSVGVTEFAYDSASRLSSVRKDGVQVSAYEYDANGNRTRVTTQAGVMTGAFDLQDRLQSYGTYAFSYTANGERSSKAAGPDTTRYGFAATGELTSVSLPDGRRIEYVLDANGRRIGKKVDGSFVAGWLYDGELAIVAEVGATTGAALNPLQTRFVFAEGENAPAYMVRGTHTYRIVTDERGSVRFAIDVADGSIAQQIDYDEYGVVLQNTNPGFQPFGFAGGLYDHLTGLVHFGARDYDPSTGRWISKDPIGFRSGSTNHYAYVSNDPVNWIDANGLDGSLAEAEATSTGTAAGTARAVPIKLYHKLVQQGSCFVIQAAVMDVLMTELFQVGGVAAKSIYEVELEGGVSYVGKTSRPLFKRIAEHLLAGKKVQKATRVFLDWGGLSAADAEATVLADVLRSKGIVGKLGSEGVLTRIANKINPAKGISKLCP